MFLLSAALPVVFSEVASFLAGSTLGAVLSRLSIGRRSKAGVSPAIGVSHFPIGAEDGASGLDDGARSPMLRYMSVVSRRARTGRLPLPKRVTELTPVDVPALAPVDVFVDRLAELPMAAWLTVGRALIADRTGEYARAKAFAILEETIGSHELEVAAWYVRDAVETSAFLASAPMSRWTSEERRAFAAACAAAEEAALALLARDHLPDREFNALYAPLQRYVALDAPARRLAQSDIEN